MWEIGTLALLAAVHTTIAISAVLRHTPLGHDEAVYALRARYFVTGSPLGGDDGLSSRWAGYRAPGLPWVISVSQRLFGESDATGRTIVVVFSIVLLVGTWTVARLVVDRITALAAVALVMTAGGFANWSTVIAVDPPGAALAMIGVAIFVYAIRDGEVGDRVFVIPLVALVATLFRYGAPSVLFAGLGSASLIALPTLWRRQRWAAIARLGVLAGLTGGAIGLVLLTDAFNRGFDPPLVAQRQLGRLKGLSPATGWADFRAVVHPDGSPIDMGSGQWYWTLLIGGVIALVGAGAGWLTRRGVGFALIAGVVSLGLTIAGVGQVVPQYLILTLPFWAILAAAGVAWLAQLCLGVMGRARPFGIALFALAGLAFFVPLVFKAGDAVANGHDRLDRSNDLRTASVVSADHFGGDCLLLTTYAPQVGWYSGCITNTFGYVAALEEIDSAEQFRDLITTQLGIEQKVEPDGVATLIASHGRFQPRAELLQAVEDVRGEIIAGFGDHDAGNLGYIEVRMLDPCLITGSCP